MTRIAYNAGSAFLFASFGFMVASLVAYNTSFRPWSDGLASAAGWNAALGVALYAIEGALRVVRFIAARRRVQQ
jgi:hypothetical protein